MSLLAPILLFFAAVLLQGLFAGYETGFVSASMIRIRYLAEEEQQGRAAQLLPHLERPDYMLTCLLIGTNICVVLATVMVTEEVRSLFPALQNQAVVDVIATAVVAPTLLVFGEILPKSVFRLHPNRLALALFPTIRVLNGLLTPLAWPSLGLSRLLLRAMGGGGQGHSPFGVTLEEVRVLVDEGVDHGTIEPEEQVMIHNVIDLQNTSAKDVMVPRINIDALPETASRGDLVALFLESGRTRIPIYRESIDDVVGVVNAYDLLLEEAPDDAPIGTLVRDVMHVPDTLRLDDLLKMMREARQHIAIVTDEYGGTDGLVTIEDVLEEIFGEICDEYDREENPLQCIGPGTYVVDASMTLEELGQALDLPLEDDNIDTVAGWVMRLAGRIPSAGEVFEQDGRRITVLEASANRVAKVRLEVPESLSDDGPCAAGLENSDEPQAPQT